MRTRLPFALSLFAATLAACTAPSGDDAESQDSNVTGGSSKVEKPTVFLFEAAAAENAAPKCMGALLGDKVAITLKSCAKVGMTIARDKGKDATKVTKVHVPTEADAEIAIVELEKEIKGTHARLTHMPLRSGYAVNGIAAVDGSGLFGADQGEGSSIDGSMIEESALHGSLAPKKGSELCAGDLGAPVCSTTGAKILGIKLAGTCGLSGLVVGPSDAPAQTASTAPPATGCSDRPWKVAQIGRHAEFIKQYAPGAFEPMKMPILRFIPYVPDGLWGYKTAGKVKTCKIDTTTLATTPAGNATTAISATVSFAEMQERAGAWGRFGIAPKAEPTKITWLPAKAVGPTRGAAFETKFEGVVSAATNGDYLVVFRASANGGESWIQCDTDGIENGFDAANGIALKVAPVETPPATPPTTTPQDTPPTTDDGYSDPPPYTSETESDPSAGPEEAAEGFG
jgi:hypothetical protein